MASLFSLHLSFTFLFGVLLSVFLISGQPYCAYEQGRNFYNTNGCKALEHCSGEYNHNSGECTKPQQCEPGWMGTSCQYVNLALNPLNKDAVFDGNMMNNHTISIATVNLNGNFVVSALNIFLVDQQDSDTTIVISDKLNNICFRGRFPQETSTIYLSRPFMTEQLIINFGRFIRIREIEVFGGRNIALWKKTNQSTVYYEGSVGFTSDKAVDGNGAGDFNLNKTCSHTSANEANATWDLQLDKAYSIIAIKIKNRIDSNQHRIDGFKLFATTSQGGKLLLYHDLNPPSAARHSILIDSSHIPNIPVTGITIEGSNSGDKILTLCEVYVYACRPVNVGGADCLNFCPKNCKEGSVCNSSEDFTCPACKEGWKGPYCDQPIQCQKPAMLGHNLQILPNKSTYHYKEIINFTCATGFNLHGNLSRQCLQSTDFQQDLPSCLAITCQRPLVRHPLQISVETSRDKYMYNQYVDFYCNDGFILQGSRKKYCKHTGDFEHDMPSCAAIHCQRPARLSPNIQILPDKTIYHYGEMINFTCSIGFNLHGNSVKQCIQSKDFQQDLPSCFAIICQRPLVQNPLHISVETARDKYMYNQSITFDCNAGFNLQGQKTKYCKNTGDFEQDLPNCTAITCQRPLNIPEHLIVHSNKTTYGYQEKLPFYCEDGFNRIGESKIVCGDEGKFVPALPQCQAVQCSRSSLDSEHMSIDPSNDYYSYNTKLSFSCNEGYNLVGPSNAVCGNNNTFVFNDAGFPKCKAVKCSLPSFMQSEIKILKDKDTTSFAYNSTVIFDCKKGFNLKGSQLGICGQNHSFLMTEGRPFCEAVQCKLPDFKNKFIYNVYNQSSYNYKETVTLQCKSGYETTENLTGICDDGNIFTFTFPDEPLTCQAVQTKADSLAGPIAGGTVGSLLAVLVVIVIAVIIFQRKRRAKNENSKSNEDFHLDNIDNQYAEVNIEKKTRKQNDKQVQPNEQTSTYYNLNSSDVEKAKLARQEVYYEFSPLSSRTATAISVSELRNYVERKKREDGFFAAQFKKFYTGLQFPATAAVAPGNRSKNKYRNIYPYDDTRVALKPGNGPSDFINASFIHGYGNLKSYIAAQGPLVNTIDDFWWMVWTERCEKIVMLTNLIEDDKVKCIQYWPEKDKMDIGNMSLEVVDIESFADFTIRTICIKNNKERRIIRQFHFTAWPDKGVPLYASSLVHFHSKVIHTADQGKGPLVVHCSAGIGRTGTFIALDILTHQAKESGFVDVFGCVETLRRQRVNMVQTLEQYVFVHDVLLEALMCTSSDPSTAEFPQIYQNLLNIDPESRKRNIDLYFEDISAALSSPPESAYRLAKDPANKLKNRYSNILPVDTEMPELKDEDNKRIYINAVFLPAYKTKRSFIVTQMPLKQTVEDFWRLIFDQKVSTIVLLNETEQEKSTGKQNIGMYWPDLEKTSEFGIYRVTTQKQENEEQDYTVIDLLCCLEEGEKEEKNIRIFKCNFWPDSTTVPNSVLKFLKMINAVELHNDRNNTGPVVVQCMNGAEKSGLFCVLQVVLERMKIEQDVAIHQIIQQMRSVRPSIIPNVEQLKFCYDAVMEFLNQFDAYSNFQ